MSTRLESLKEMLDIIERADVALAAGNIDKATCEHVSDVCNARCGNC